MSVKSHGAVGSVPEMVLGRFQGEGIAGLDPSSAASAIAKAADVAIVVSPDATVLDIAVNAAEVVNAGAPRWLGARFVDLVTIESREKITALMGDDPTKLRRWRQLNHPVEGSQDLPVEYCVIYVWPDGRRILAGRELAGLSGLQQRLMNTQLSMEREYARVRSAEARYRILFQVTSEAVLIVDATSERVIEANPAAAALFDAKASRLTSIAVATLFEPSDVPRLQALFAAVRLTGGSDDSELRSASGSTLNLSASMFRQGTKGFFLIRALSPDGAPVRGASHLDELIERMPEGFVVVDAARNVIGANSAFVELTQLASVEQLRGEPVTRWIGRTGIDVDVLFGALRQNHLVKEFATVVRGEHDTIEQVEMSGVAVTTALGEACYGLTVRIVRPSVVGLTASLERSVEQLTELVGRVPLKDLVRDTTDMIERLCIEAALRITGNNRVSAAELLGLSRQSLYVKMRRFDQLAPGTDIDEL